MKHIDTRRKPVPIWSRKTDLPPFPIDELPEPIRKSVDKRIGDQVSIKEAATLAIIEHAVLHEYEFDILTEGKSARSRLLFRDIEDTTPFNTSLGLDMSIAFSTPHMTSSGLDLRWKTRSIDSCQGDVEKLRPLTFENSGKGNTARCTYSMSTEAARLLRQLKSETGKGAIYFIESDQMMLQLAIASLGFPGLACLFQHLEQPDSDQIRAEDVAAPCEVARWYWESSLNPFLPSPSTVNRTKELYEWLTKTWGKDSIKLSDIKAHGPRDMREEKVAFDSVVLLLERHWLDLDPSVEVEDLENGDDKYLINKFDMKLEAQF